MNARLYLVVAVALVFATAAAAQETGSRFGLPVDCEMGTVCFVQNYVDRDPGPLARDYACGLLSYDGHKGTDIRVADLVTMRQGVAVVAAAAGTVQGMRDEMPDTGIQRRGDPAVQGREYGNGVVLDHGGGWVSQYCHMRQGSVVVTPGQRVEAGAMLGLIGQSGEAMFPHVHFEVRKDETVIDPFAGAPATTPCGARAVTMLSAEAASTPIRSCRPARRLSSCGHWSMACMRATWKPSRSSPPTRAWCSTRVSAVPTGTRRNGSRTRVVA